MDKEFQQLVPEGYKLTEVGVVPNDWVVKTIEGLTYDVGDGIHSTPVYSSAGDYYFVNGNNIVNGSIKITEETKKVDGKEFQKHKKNLSLKTIFLSINGTIGNLAFYNNEPLVLGKSAAYMNVKERYSLNYVYYSLQTKSTYDFFSDGLTGSTIKNLGLGVIRATPIPIPIDTEEQTAIANALSDVDALITSLEKLIAKKRAIKTAAMQQLLTGKKRLPPFDKLAAKNGTPRYKQTELGEIPEDWEVQALSEVVDVRDGTHDSPVYQESGVRLVTSKNIVGNRLELESASYISEKAAVEVNKRSQVHAGDILMSMIGTIGSAVLVTKEPDYCIKNIALFKPKKISSEFLIQLVISSIFQNLLSDSLDGGIQKFVSLGSLRNLNIIIPSGEEQFAIVAVLSDMDEELKVLEKRLRKTQQLKQGMMQELLTGRTRLI